MLGSICRISILLCFLVFTIFESSIYAQKYGSDVEHELHLKGGYGVSYSGYGANVEWRNRRIGAGFTAGYLPKQKYEFATLSPSFQYSIIILVPPTFSVIQAFHATLVIFLYLVIHLTIQISFHLN